MSTFQRLPSDHRIDSPGGPREDDYPGIASAPKFRDLSLNRGPNLAGIKECRRVHRELTRRIPQNEDIALTFAKIARETGLLTFSNKDHSTLIAELREQLPHQGLEFTVELFNRHRKLFKEKFAGFDNSINQTKGCFLTKLLPLIKTGKVPLDPQKTSGIIKDTPVTPFNSFTFSLPNIAYSPERHEVDLSSCVLFDLEDADLFHEFFHRLSGTSIICAPHQGIDEAIVQKQGLVFNSFCKTNEIYIRAFEWLDEGLTEYLTQTLLKNPQDQFTFKMSDLNQYEVYPKEIKALYLLVNKFGVSIDSLTSAYFENFQIDAPKGQRLPAMRALLKATNVGIENGFLRKLDQLGRDNKGIDSIVEYLENADVNTTTTH